ncbi:MAG: hypothetical protein WB239_10065, partial [Acidimicrobiia bacterium]
MEAAPAIGQAFDFPLGIGTREVDALPVSQPGLHRVEDGCSLWCGIGIIIAGPSRSDHSSTAAPVPLGGALLATGTIAPSPSTSTGSTLTLTALTALTLAGLALTLPLAGLTLTRLARTALSGLALLVLTGLAWTGLTLTGLTLSLLALLGQSLLGIGHLPRRIGHRLVVG